MSPARATRATLTDAALDHFAAGARLDESLRATATALDVGHSLLLYHFGSRDGLLAAVHGRCEQRQREHLDGLRTTASSPVAVMRRMWQHLADPAMWPLYRLGFAMRAQGLAHRGEREQWLSALRPVVTAAGVPDAEVGAHAVLWAAVANGLLWDLVIGGDRAGVDAAAETFFARYDDGVARRAPHHRGR